MAPQAEDTPSEPTVLKRMKEIGLSNQPGEIRREALQMAHISQARSTAFPLEMEE